MSMPTLIPRSSRGQALSQSWFDALILNLSKGAPEDLVDA